MICSKKKKISGLDQWFSVIPQDQQQSHHRGVCETCQFSAQPRPTKSDTPGVGPTFCALARPLSDSAAPSNSRTTGVALLSRCGVETNTASPGSWQEKQNHNPQPRPAKSESTGFPGNLYARIKGVLQDWKH